MNSGCCSHRPNQADELNSLRSQDDAEKEIERLILHMQKQLVELEGWRQQASLNFPPDHRKLLEEQLNKFRLKKQHSVSPSNVLACLEAYSKEIGEEIKVYEDVMVADPGIITH
jgi:selenocysteine-specific translation elongation factor